METRLKQYEQAIQSLEKVCEQQKELTIKARKITTFAEAGLLFIMLATAFFLIV